MTTISATPPLPFHLREEAWALASSVALTAVFVAAYVVIAPFILLGALAGGPIWAALLLAREA